MIEMEISSDGVEKLRNKLKFEDVYNLAKLSGVSPRAIYNIISGKSTPTIATMERLIKWMQ